MTTAATERIALELVSRLEDITTGNGYSLSVSDVERVNRDGTDWTPKHLAAAVVQQEEERNEEHDYPGNPPASAYELKFLIHGYVRLPDRSASKEDAIANDFKAAIQKGIASVTDWHQFDSVSYDAEFGTSTIWQSTDHKGTTVELTVRYRVSEYDPYTVRA